MLWRNSAGVWFRRKGINKRAELLKIQEKYHLKNVLLFEVDFMNEIKLDMLYVSAQLHIYALQNIKLSIQES